MRKKIIEEVEKNLYRKMRLQSAFGIGKLVPQANLKSGFTASVYSHT
jgi:hypothetical protein